MRVCLLGGVFVCLLAACSSQVAGDAADATADAGFEGGLDVSSSDPAPPPDTMGTDTMVTSDDSTIPNGGDGATGCALPCDTSHSVGGRCVDGVCVYNGCAPGFSDCDNSAPNVDGCECATPECCGNACATAHSNGVGQTFYDCAPLGTYNLIEALEACAAYTGDVNVCSVVDFPQPCMALDPYSVVCALGAPNYVTWSAVNGPVARNIAGHVAVGDPSMPGCPCVSATDPTWE